MRRWTGRNYAGVVNVFASGNLQYGSVTYPACHSKTIAVGATDSLDHKWRYSQYGDDLDVVAPSGALDYRGDIWTLDQMGAAGENDGTDDCLAQDADYLCSFGGTSAAAPQVAGIITMVMLRRPDLIGNPDRVRRIIRLSSEREQYGVYDTLRVNNQVGWGRVNADRALLSVTHGDCNNDGLIDIDDIVYLISYVCSGGPEPVPHYENGNVNCRDEDPSVDIDDIVYLVNYVYGGGPEPPDCFFY
jgi:subtilisin family serine protease